MSRGRFYRSGPDRAGIRPSGACDGSHAGRDGTTHRWPDRAHLKIRGSETAVPLWRKYSQRPDDDANVQRRLPPAIDTRHVFNFRRGKNDNRRFARVFAATASKQRVLMIDCDLRAQSVSRQFNLLEKPGLTNYLTGEIDGEQVIYRVGASNLAILPAGTTNCNPPDLLGSERMRALLHTLRDSFDIIYMDAPPLLPVIDSALLSKLADKVVFVVRWRTTPRNIAIRASQLIDNQSRKISGVALNGINVDQLMSYDPYSTYYSKMYMSNNRL